MSQTIFKMAGKKDPFSRLPNTTYDDPRLSWQAKGILGYLSGKPDGWKVRVTDLANRSTNGACAVRAALKLLRLVGYAELTKVRGEQGRIKEWVWKISDSPIFRPPDSGFPQVDNQQVGNRHISKKELSKAADSKKTAALESSSGESEESHAVSTGSPDAVDAHFPATWRPISGTKAQQLAKLRTPPDAPSEPEFDDFLDSEGLDHLLMGKRDMYNDLAAQKWHHWAGRRWRKIRDWRAYVTALNTKIEEATCG